MQCILTVAVAAVVTASHRDLQAKPHYWYCFPSLSPLSSLYPCNTHFFPWPRRSHHQRLILFYRYYFIYHLHLAKTGKCSFTTNNFLVNGRFPSHPLSTACLCLPLSFVPSCFPCPPCAVALLELAATHCPILGCSCQGHPLPTALTALRPHGGSPGPRQSVTNCPRQDGSVDMGRVEMGSALVRKKQEAHPQGK